MRKLFEVDDIIQVGQTIAVIEIVGEGAIPETSTPEIKVEVAPSKEVLAAVEAPIVENCTECSTKF